MVWIVGCGRGGEGDVEVVDCEEGELRGEGEERGVVGCSSEWWGEGGEWVESIY